LDFLSERLTRSLSERVNTEKQHYSLLTYKLMLSDPSHLVKQKQDDLQTLKQQLQTEMNRFMENQVKRFDYAVQSLDYLSPLKIMNRGYSYITKDDKVIKNAEQVQVEDLVHIHLHEGSIEAKVVNKMEE